MVRAHAGPHVREPMFRLFLLIIFGLVAAMYFPDSRAMLLDKGAPDGRFGRLPDRRQFPTWLDDQYSGGANRDSWGNAYEYLPGRRDFQLRSYGPDRIRSTEDDLVVTRVLN